ncbi:hypothetical protein A6A04_07710 [Paramagnetospirillum marisnigri]|uniref:Uncharacterized protein n=1 Tax=Paramagnetospirillum marisnigri TaxID=1285242 RepID=A0A178M841_9PROT|nr:hypothetical protein [Paramagnetospirillum marisnigri]OAN44703.1 hypothetical protein A6A04_07710 [Paramagnetospirillum marisnigri]
MGWRCVLAMVLALGLGGCGVPDLVAHTIKEVEKSQRDGGGKASTAEPSRPAATDSRAEEEPPPPVRAPQPARSSVTVEELPAR